MRLLKKPYSAAGFTLVEVAIAVSIFTIVLAGILGLYYQSVLVTKKMNQVFIATNLAKNRLESLYNLEFDSISTAEETDTLLDEEGNTDANGKFKRTTTVATQYEGHSDLTQVTVTVDYEVKGEFSGNPVTLITVYVEE